MTKEEKFSIIKQYIYDKYIGTTNSPQLSFLDSLKEELEETLGMGVSISEIKKAIYALDDEMFECGICGWMCEICELAPDACQNICVDCYTEEQ